MLNERETNLVLAALRGMQHDLLWYKKMPSDSSEICPLPAPTIEEIDALCEFINCMGTPKVVIEVRGGIAEATEAPDWIDVEIIDYDNLEELT